MLIPFHQKLFCSIGLAVFAGQALAQSSAPAGNGQRIGDVVVSASLVGTELKDMTQNTSILTNEEIKNAPDQTIDQVFKNQSSVFLNDTPYYEKDVTAQSINVRGLGNQRTLVLIDGVPANNAMYGTVEWNRAPISAVEDVEFIRGGVSDLYGNMGMGGVVNITTKPISNDKGEVSASYGSYGTGNVALSKDHAVNDVLKLRISADYFSTEGYVQQPTISPATKYPQTKTTSVSASPQAAPLLPNMGPTSANAANYRLDGTLKLSADTDAFFKMGSHNFTNLAGPGGYAFAPKTMQETTFSAGSSTRMSANQKVDVNAFYENGSLWQQNVTNTPPNSPYISSNYANPFSTVGASGKYLHKFQDFAIDEFMAGVDARQVAAQNLTNSFSSVNSKSNLPGKLTSSAYAKGQQEFYGVMAQFKSKASAVPLQTTLTLREDQWQSQVPTYWLAGSNNIPGYANIPNQTVYKFSPNLGLLLQASKELDFRAAAYQGFHAPGLNNTIRSYASSSSVSLSNPYLTPENMTGYEVGADYRWNAGFVQVTGFSAQVKNAIYAPNVTQSQAFAAGCPASVCTGVNGQTFSLYGNNQTLQSQGLELQAHHDLSTHWALDGTYTHTNTTLTWIGTGVSALLNPTGTQVGGIPQNMGYAAITFTPLEKTSLSLNARYIGNSWMDTPHTLPVPSYTVIGLRANYQVTPQASVFASVVNLFNRTYITYNAATNQSSYTLGQPQSINVGARINF